MDPLLIDADDKHRASQEEAGSGDFVRMLRLVKPHWRFIAMGLAASLIYGMLHSISIIAMMPVLKVVLSEEGFDGWVQRVVVQDRIDADLVLDSFDDQDAESPDLRLLIVKLRSESDLAAAGVSEGSAIVAVDGQGGAPLELLSVLAEAEGSVVLGVMGPSDADEPETIDVTVALGQPSFSSKVLRYLASFVPAERTRSDRRTTLFYVLSLVVVLVLISNVTRIVARYMTAIGVLRGVMDLRRHLYGKILRLPMDFFTQNSSDLVSRFVQDAQEIQRGLMAVFGKMVREPLRAVFLVIIALYLNTRMTLTMMLIGPVVVVIFWYAGRQIRKANKRLLQAYGTMIGALTNTLQSIAVVKAYNAEHLERRQLWRIDRTMFKYQLRVALVEAFMHPALEVLGLMAVCGATYWLGAQVLERRIDLAEFGVLVIALGMLLDPLRKVANVYPRIMRSSAGARRIFSVLDAPAEAELLEGAVTLAPLTDKIEFKNVSFTYPGGTSPALDGVSVTLRKGETIAVVGPNGSGKTTLTRLLVRFYDPQQGGIYFDGVEIRQARLRSLRRQFSWVSQDPVVFAMTIAQNIAYGARGVDRAMIEQAAHRAHADDFIQDKAEAYDEWVGERGVTLSGGQRQRLCIARAVLRNAPVLIFDEATSQVDSESEQKIQASIAELSRDRTTLIIAHRLSTIRFASRILVMDQGKIVDSGTHEELLKRCPLYQTLCQTQLGN